MAAPSTSDIAIVTPWYPSRQRPFLGAFVQAMVEATAPDCKQMTVYQCDEWVHPLSPEGDAAIGRAQEKLLPLAAHPGRTVAGARLVYLPVPLPPGLSYAEITRRHEDTLRRALRGTPIEAPVVHAHVGLPGGWAALRNARADSRVFVTEHATFLDLVLAQPEARAMYDEMLHRCSGFFAVGRAVRAPLVEAFPHHAERIGVIPNPVSFDHQRPTPVTELRRWLYVGGLSHRKGVLLLLEAFAACLAEDAGLTLTFVGTGPLLSELTTRAGQLGIGEAVGFTGAVSQPEALRLMREHDLLVHPSRFETFGMTVVEAIAAGMAVLVTRCGGPEETLAGIENAAGEMIDVEETPDSLVAAYWRLRKRFPGDLDLARARTELAGRYSYQSVALAHRRVWFPDGPVECPPTTVQGAQTDA